MEMLTQVMKKKRERKTCISSHILTLSNKTWLKKLCLWVNYKQKRAHLFSFVTWNEKAAGDRVSWENLGYLPFPCKTVSQSMNQAHCANNFWYSIFVCSFLGYCFIMLIGRGDTSNSWQKRKKIVYSAWSANVLNRIMDVSFFLCKAQLLNLSWISTRIISSVFFRHVSTRNRSSNNSNGL